MARRKSNADAVQSVAPREPENSGLAAYSVAYPHGLNLRAEPRKTAAVLRIMPHGERVEIDAGKDSPEGWAAVKGGGWCMVEYLE